LRGFETPCFRRSFLAAQATLLNLFGRRSSLVPREHLAEHAGGRLKVTFVTSTGRELYVLTRVQFPRQDGSGVVRR